MKIGIVCPYSWDVPGGVQQHIRDLAETLIDVGHDVSVISPADDDTPLPPYVVGAGRAVPVPYNGSVARLSFGFLSARRVRRWPSPCPGAPPSAGPARPSGTAWTPGCPGPLPSSPPTDGVPT